MTDMLQKSKNVANNVVNENSQDLTEQWKKGELPSGWYYVRLIRGEYRIDLYINGKNEWIDCPDNIIDTVVCEVPSYDELQNMNKAVNECMVANIKLVEQNAQLKELLKEIRGKIKTIYDMDLNQFITSAAFTDNFVKKIDEVLK